MFLKYCLNIGDTRYLRKINHYFRNVLKNNPYLCLAEKLSDIIVYFLQKKLGRRFYNICVKWASLYFNVKNLFK